MKRILALVAMAGLLLTACSDSGGAGDMLMVGDSAEGGGESAADGGESSPDEGGSGSDEQAANVSLELAAESDREVIREASLELHASDTRQAFDDIVAMVESAGGFVAHANVFPVSSEDEQPAVAMTLRVPADRLNATMTAIKESVDEVVAESQGAEDVTEQFIDLEARLTNLEALEIELRALLTEVRAQENSDPEKILRVFNELSLVRGQIEGIQGQLDYLEDATALATLDVQVTQTPSAIPIVDEPWAPVETAREALRNLVTGLENVADWLIAFGLYALPMLLVTVGPLVLIGVFAYRRFIRKPEPTEPTPAES